MTQASIAVKIVLDRWNASLATTSKILQELNDDQLAQQIVPGKNRGIYLLGHLIAVHDDMLRLLGLGDKQYPELGEPFVKEADNPAAPFPAAATLRAIWETQVPFLKEKFATLTIDDWFTRHTAVSEADFQKEPHRNKLNIIITRTSHLEYHAGQLILLKK